MSFSAKVKEDSLIASGRHCSLCHKFCGIKIEIHHIKPKSQGGANTLTNAIPLCFDCHADMRTYDAKHPKGTKYTEAELIRHRDNWFNKVKATGGVQLGNTIAETDKVIYEKLTKVLPWQGSLSFLSTNNFAGFSFQLDALNDLNNFLDLNNAPAFEFIDSDLEGAKSNLESEITYFLQLIDQNTFPTTHNIRLYHVPPEWETENNEHFNKIVNEIHTASQTIYTLYKDLLRMGRRKLGIVSTLS